MANQQRIGIDVMVNAASAHAELPRVGNELKEVGSAAERASSAVEQAGAFGAESMGRLSLSVGDVVKSAAGLGLVVTAVRAISDAMTALPRAGFDFTGELEVAQLGMAGVLGSMTAINGHQTTWNQGLQIAGNMITKLNDDALRTAATSQELVGVFQALLAPGLSAGMTLDQIRQLTVVGTNAVKSIGLQGYQVVQELRDLVSGGITAAGSSLATALNLRDEDISKAKASAEGLFAFLMNKLQGFKSASEDFNDTLKGSLAGLEEGATRVAAAGMQPLTASIKRAVTEANKLLLTFDQSGNATLNGRLIYQLQDYSRLAVDALHAGKDAAQQIWSHRDAVVSLGTAYGGLKLGQWASSMYEVARAQLAQLGASKLAAVQAVTQQAVDQEAVLTSRQKVAALLDELRARQAATAAEVDDAAAKMAALQIDIEAIQVSRSEAVARLDAARATVAQAAAQLKTAQATAGLGVVTQEVRVATEALTSAQARQSAVMTELAVLGQQQSRVNAQLTASATAQTAATEAQAVASSQLAAAQTAAATATSASTLVMRGFATVVAGLGGPVGIAIAAVSALVFELYRLKAAGDDADKRRIGINRAKAEATAGRTPQARDVASMEAELAALQDKRDELLLSIQEASKPRTVDLAPFKHQVAVQFDRQELERTNAAITQMETDLTLVRGAMQRSGDASDSVTLKVEATRQAWVKANADVKSASNIQDEYTQKLQASRNAYSQYVEQLKKSGATPKALADAASRQAENEKGLAAERDKALLSLGATAGKVAEALTKLDLESIRAQAQTTESAINNAQQILEAQHAAGLVEDATYYQARMLLMQQMAQAQIEELKAENERLAAQKLTGQDALDRDRQMAVNTRKIAQEQAELFAKTYVLTTQATSAMNARTAATLAARQAAQDYLDTQRQQQDRDLATYGRGSRQRSMSAGLNQIQDRYAQQRRDLENAHAQLIAQQEGKLTAQQAQDYSDRLTLIDEFQAKALGSYRTYYEQLGVLQGDWKNGATEALADYADQAANVADGTKTLFTNALTGIEGVFVDLATKGKASFSDLADSILADIVRIEARIAISAAAQYIANAVGFSFGSTSGGAGTVSGGNGLTFKPNALGDVYRSQSLSAHSGTVVNRPTVFAFAAGAGLMGEAGPEGIFPLKRNSAGQLGVVATTAPAQLQQPKVTVNNYMGQDAQATVTQDDQGNVRVDFERRVLSTVAGDMAAGGQTARATAGRMGLNNGATLRRRRG